MDKCRDSNAFRTTLRASAADAYPAQRFTGFVSGIFVLRAFSQGLLGYFSSPLSNEQYRSFCCKVGEEAPLVLLTYPLLEELFTVVDESLETAPSPHVPA